MFNCHVPAFLEEVFTRLRAHLVVKTFLLSWGTRLPAPDNSKRRKVQVAPLQQGVFTTWRSYYAMGGRPYQILI